MKRGLLISERILWCGLWLLLLTAGCDLLSSEESTEEPEPRTGRGATQSITVLSTTTADQLNNQFREWGIPLGALFPVISYKIVYETIDPQGTVTTASGAFLVPNTGPIQKPLLSFQHGTTTIREEVPSADSTQRLIGLAFASQGYMVSMPDLLGLGDSPGLHPYLHAASSATAVVDMLRATMDYIVAEKEPWNNQLFNLLGD